MMQVFVGNADEYKGKDRLVKDEKRNWLVWSVIASGGVTTERILGKFSNIEDAERFAEQFKR